MKKRIHLIISLMLVFLFATTPVMADYNYNVEVYVDGSQVAFPDQLPFINPETNRTMVPLRFVSDALGAKDVQWMQEQQQAAIYKDSVWIYMPINSKVVTVNKPNPNYPKESIDEQVTLDAPAILVNDRTMVPLRFISEVFKCDVKWIAPTGESKGKAMITSPVVKEDPKEDPKEEPKPEPNENGEYEHWWQDPRYIDANIRDDGEGVVIRN